VLAAAGARAPLGRARGAHVELGGGRIDALVLCEGVVLRTAAPEVIRYGVAQVRRLVESPALRLLHVVFAPSRPRPVLLGVARLANRLTRPLALEYTETWGVVGEAGAPAEGACEIHTPQGIRALAEASVAIRARPPEDPPRHGLLLGLRLGLPPRTRRDLAFAYAAPEPGEAAAPLVRAWRGAVAAELEHSVERWREALGGAPDLVHAYRQAVEAAGDAR
jgi:hypothetical protein